MTVVRAIQKQSQNGSFPIHAIVSDREISVVGFFEVFVIREGKLCEYMTFSGVSYLICCQCHPPLRPKLAQVDKSLTL